MAQTVEIRPTNLRGSDGGILPDRHAVQPGKSQGGPSPVEPPRDQDRCPHCGYLHLRAGYCQALDPGNPGFRTYKGKPWSAEQLAAYVEHQLPSE